MVFGSKNEYFLSESDGKKNEIKNDRKAIGGSYNIPANFLLWKVTIPCVNIGSLVSFLTDISMFSYDVVLVGVGLAVVDADVEDPLSALSLL